MIARDLAAPVKVNDQFKKPGAPQLVSFAYPAEVEDERDVEDEDE